MLIPIILITITIHKILQYCNRIERPYYSFLISFLLASYSPIANLTPMNISFSNNKYEYHELIHYNLNLLSLHPKQELCYITHKNTKLSQTY